MPAIHIRRCDIHLVQLRTRMPFKYGIATMTDVPHAFVRVQAEMDGKSTQGISADLLPPKWFTKDPDKPVRDEILDMIRVVQQAVWHASDLRADSAFELWRMLYARQDAWAQQEKIAPLLAHFGTSFVERALIEAVCRAFRRPFSECLTGGVLGLRLGDVHASLQGTTPEAQLQGQRLNHIILRHTVGLLDPLLDEQIPAADRLQDGLPQSLNACIRAYGLTHFKIKVTGHLDHDLDRLQQIARILNQSAQPHYRFTLDGNEQFQSITSFRSYWETVSQDQTLQEFLKHLLFVEQPLHRNAALRDEIGPFFAEWPSRPPIIIDESDSTLDSLPTALRLGYAGTSHKNCKGVFKGIANRCLLLKEAADHPQTLRIMSGEDLCTIGPVSVLQDLTVMAALGIESVERNGHHYFPGLSMFPKEIQDQVASAHADLYETTAKGWPKLRIRNGQLDVGSLNQAPFGVGFQVEVERFTPVDKFRV